MKVCDLTQFYSPVSGGVKRYVQEKVRFIEGLEPTGESLKPTGDGGLSGSSHLLIIPGERDERIAAGQSVVYTIRSPLLSRTSGYRALVRLGAIDEIIARERPDIIECGDPYQVAWRSISTGRLYGIPVVGFYHSHFAEAYLRYATQKLVPKLGAKWGQKLGPKITAGAMNGAQRYVSALYNRFARTLVPSPALAALLTEWGVKNTASVDLGIDTTLFCPLAQENVTESERTTTRRDLGLPPLLEGCQLLLYIGRLAQEKNTQTLFEAFERRHRAGAGRFHLLIVGDGLQRSLVRALQIATQSVTWLPYCADPAQLARIYRAADLFIHPGVQETFGLVSLESQACGTPVVGIRGSYMDRIIHTNQSHWAKENTPEALAAAIEASAQGICDGSLKADAATASTTIHARYSWDHVFQQLFGIYQSTIDAYKNSDA